MTSNRPVTLEGWRNALLDEVLFRGASQLSDAGEPAGDRSLVTTLTVRFTAIDDNGSLELILDSLVDGPIVTVLTPPF